MNRLLTDLINSKIVPIIFGYDGVLFEARWLEDRIMADEDSKDDEASLYAKPILPAVSLVESVKSPCYVFAKAHSEEEKEFKLKQLEKYYPKIEEDNVYFVDKYNSVIQTLTMIFKGYGCLAYIDADLDKLIKYESRMDCRCKFFHSSSLYAEA